MGGEGFEPPKTVKPTDLQSVAINHYATLPVELACIALGTPFNHLGDSGPGLIRLRLSEFTDLLRPQHPDVAGIEGLEPTAHVLTAHCSNQLSYIPIHLFCVF